MSVEKSIILEKEYSWEDLSDIYEDIDCFLYLNNDTKGEFEGTVKITLEYIK